MIQIDVEGHRTWALIDSGADISMISQDFAKEAVPKGAMQFGSFGCVSEAAGGKVNVMGRADVPFRINATQFIQPMAIIPGLVYQVIRGRDFCCAQQTTLDDKAGIFRVGDQEIALPTYEELRPKKAKALTCATVTIPPRSRTITHVVVQAVDGGVKKKD